MKTFQQFISLCEGGLARQLSNAKDKDTGHISADRGSDEGENRKKRKGLEKDLKKKGIGYKKTRVKVVKNKVSPPFKQAEFQIMYGQGINVEGEILEYGQKLGLVEKAGAWYSHNGEKIGQGKVNASNFLKENSKIKNSLLKEIRNSYINTKNKSKK